MDPLATADDVAQALGLADAAAFSTSQSVRVAALLARVSREFRREAERDFTPGTTTVKLLTVAGRVRLTDPVTAVTSVTVLDCSGDPVDVEYEVDGQELLITHPAPSTSFYPDGTGLYPSGVEVTVTYSHTASVPEEVVAAVAAIVGRNLTVDPNSVAAQATDMSAGPFRTRYAEWTSNSGVLTEDDCREARSYRYPGTSAIIQRP